MNAELSKSLAIKNTTEKKKKLNKSTTKKTKYNPALFDSQARSKCYQRSQYTHKWAIPCQRSEKKGRRQKVDFFEGM